MNRKNLVELMVAAAAMAALCGPASAQQPAAELDGTRSTWLACVRAAIPRLDRPEATSDAVAHAAMNSCADQYTAMLGPLSRTWVPTCGQDSDCTRAALAKAEREATKTATDEVVSARIRVAGAQVLICQ